MRAPRLLKEDLLVDNGLEVGSLLVPVLNGFVVGDLNAVHLQLEVVPWREKHYISKPLPFTIKSPVAASLYRPGWHVTSDLLR